MNIVHSDQEIEGISLITPSVFLAGPTPRDRVTKSWRPDAIKLFSETPYAGEITIFIPERKSKEFKVDYTDQVEWERKGLRLATIILFWVPRKLDTMPAFTTNVEFGYYIACRPEAVLYGRPDNSEKNRYLDWLYTLETKKEPIKTLEDLVKVTITEMENNFKK